jgi:hypothetical protein
LLSHCPPSRTRPAGSFIGPEYRISQSRAPALASTKTLTRNASKQSKKRSICTRRKEVLCDCVAPGRILRGRYPLSPDMQMLCPPLLEAHRRPVGGNRRMRRIYGR